MPQISLSELQSSVIVGSLLGDGCIRIKNRGVFDNGVFTKSQSKFDIKGIDKISYVKWHVDCFENFGGKFSFYEKRKEYEFRTSASEVFTEIENKWYIRTDLKRVKVVPKDINISPLALAVWFIDDGGNYPEKRTAMIASMSFTKDENEFLSNILYQNFNVKSNLVGKNRQKRCQLRIGSSSYVDFIEIIKPFCIWDCYKHKCDLSNYKSQTYNGGNINGMSKISYHDVVEIKCLAKSGMSQKDIATRFNIHSSAISRIISGKRWKKFINQQEILCRP